MSATGKREMRPLNHAVSAAGSATRLTKVPHWARAREYTDEILRFWAGRMRDAEEAGPVRMRASENLMDRAWGKAPVIVSGDGEAPIRIDVRSFDANAIAGLEEALMQALGSGLNAALDATRGGEGDAEGPNGR